LASYQDQKHDDFRRRRGAVELGRRTVKQKAAKNPTHKKGEAMDEPSEPKDSSRISLMMAWAALAGLCLSALYVLSMGPMLWLATHGYLSPEAKQFCSRLYEPLWLASKYVPYLKPFLHWYNSLWS
jgi:hypothetical protein